MVLNSNDGRIRLVISSERSRQALTDGGGEAEAESDEGAGEGHDGGDDGEPHQPCRGSPV